MIYYKEKAKKLAKIKATVKLLDNGTEVLRTAVGTFASRSGRTFYWGVDLDKPLSDGSTGVTCNFLIL